MKRMLSVALAAFTLMLSVHNYAAPVAQNHTLAAKSLGLDLKQPSFGLKALQQIEQCKQSDLRYGQTLSADGAQNQQYQIAQWQDARLAQPPRSHRLGRSEQYPEKSIKV